ncbi:MAG: low molecular weight phosphotyrosine protein phosphatase [Oleispira sp.]|nr:low molecular weight phosphotyrosine protein phosphatase [Oleispira sp.]
MIKVLFVCLGNICRSPTAHAVLERKLAMVGLSEMVEVDSAGTAAWHVGKQPDLRSQQTARKRDYDLSHLRARQAMADDFLEFDYVLAMDDENLGNLKAIVPKKTKSSPKLFLKSYSTLGFTQVPDPYYGGEGGFEAVLDMIEDACDQLILDIRTKL